MTEQKSFVIIKIERALVKIPSQTNKKAFSMGTFIFGTIVVVGYLFTGRMFGWLTITEIKRDTASENLNVFQKAIRMFLFPCMYWYWGRRLESLFESEAPIVLSVVSQKNKEDGIQYYYRPSREEEYYRIVTFIWPFRLFPAAIGIVEMLFFAITGVAKLTWLPFEKVFQAIENQHPREQTQKNLSETVVLALEQFDAQEARLLDLQCEARKRYDAISAALRRCETLHNTHEGSAIVSRVQKLQELLIKAHRQTSRELEDVGNALGFFSGQRKSLEGFKELGEAYSAVEALNLSGVKEREPMAEIFKIQDECASVFRRVYTVERQHMLELDMDADAIANQIVDGEEIAEQLEHRLLS